MAPGPSHFTMPPPATSTDLKASFPQEHVLLLTLNRPNRRNAISPALSRETGSVLAWFDEEPSLWYVRVTLLVHCARTPVSSWSSSSMISMIY